MQKFRTRILFGLIILFGLFCSCAGTQGELDWTELRPILDRNNLNASDPLERHEELVEIEDVDSKLYAPLAAKTIYLEARSPTSDSRGMTPRYWFRVEDYETAEKAQKRASEYRAVGAYDRIEKAFNETRESQAERSSLYISKSSVRLWATARGKRVYALTTEANLFGLIETPDSLRNAIEMLPQK